MKKYLFVLFILLVSVCSASAQQYRNPDYEAYIEKYSKIAVEQMKRHRIPASITLAQGLLESAAGKSDLARHGNNHFGIKCHGWQGRKQYHDDDENGECFRVYNSAKESFEDHSFFLQKDRYKRLFTYDITDYRSWAHGLKACGYATNPAYAQTLISIIERYELYRFDSNDRSYAYEGNGYTASQSHSNPTVTNNGEGKGNNSGKGTTNPKEKGKHDRKSYEIRFNNGVAYVISQPGDTYKTLAWNLGKSCRKLAKYNECDADDRLEPGTIVYLEKKAKQGDVKYKGKFYVVKAGDTMYSISQNFAVQLKYLYKINNLSPDNPIRVGQRLFVRL